MASRSKLFSSSSSGAAALLSPREARASVAAAESALQPQRTPDALAKEYHAGTDTARHAGTQLSRQPRPLERTLKYQGPRATAEATRRGLELRIASFHAARGAGTTPPTWSVAPEPRGPSVLVAHHPGVG
eukprot:scaffold2351_cov403-Prasinococcus_capsulatus_cf.AAC.9